MLAVADLLMIGMLCVLLTVGLWLALATFLELPVSTSHSVGQALQFLGVATAVVWAQVFSFIRTSVFSLRLTNYSYWVSQTLSVM